MAIVILCISFFQLEGYVTHVSDPFFFFLKKVEDTEALSRDHIFGLVKSDRMKRPGFTMQLL